MDFYKILQNLTSLNTENAVDYVVENLPKNFETRKNSSGSLIAHKSGTGKKFMIEAHIDEIGYLVTHIDEKGFVRLSAYGGIDTRVLPASEVTIFGEKQITGIFTSVPPHLATAENKKSAQLKDLSVDVGEDYKYISLGDFAVTKPAFSKLLNNNVSAPALDNRCGVAVLLYCAEQLENTDSDITLIFATGEEFNGAGVITSVFPENPDEAIAIDVSFATAPGISDEEAKNLTSGAMIGISPLLDRRVFKTLIQIAKEKNIPYTIEVMGSGTSTDADNISISTYGIKTGLISVPQRNMHTGAEVINIDDLTNCGKLISEYILNGGIKNA